MKLPSADDPVTTEITTNTNTTSTQEVKTDTTIPIDQIQDGTDDEQDEIDDMEHVFDSPWRPCLFRHLGFLMILGVPLVIAIFILNLFIREPLSEYLIKSVACERVWDSQLTSKLLVWLLVTIVCGTIVSFLLAMLPSFVLKINRLIAPGNIEKTKGYLEIFLNLLSTIRFVTATSIGLGFSFLFYYIGTCEKEELHHVLIFRKVVLCIFIVSCIITMEQVILEFVSTRFHRTAYQQRIEEAIYATSVLDTLNGAARNIHPTHFNPKPKPFGFTHSRRTSMSDGTADKKSRATTFTNNSTFTKTNSPPNQKKYKNIYENINKTIFEGAFEHDVDLHSVSEARKLSRKLFSFLQGSRRFILVEDFHPYFKSREEGQRAFELFDKDGNGDISKREMREKITAIYKERKDLNRALRDTSQVVGKLHYILLLIFLILSTFACLVIFGRDLYTTLIPFSTFFLGLSFIFGENAKQLFQSIIFLFVMHPYDAGDRVYMDGANLVVKRVGLLGTEFVESNGQVTYIPHTILITRIIYNVRRSICMGEKIEFQINYDTPKQKIVALKEKIDRYLEEEETREFHPNPTLAISAIENCDKLSMFIWLEHKSNWQEGAKRWARRTRFIIALREICVELGLQYTLLPLQLIHANPPPYLSNQPASTSSTPHPISFPSLPSPKINLIVTPLLHSLLPLENHPFVTSKASNQQTPLVRHYQKNLLNYIKLIN